MRGAAVLLLLLVAAVVPTASAGWDERVVVVPKPTFPQPLAAVKPSSLLRLQVVSTAKRDPAYFPPVTSTIRLGAPLTLLGESSTQDFGGRGTTFTVYGTGVIAGFGPRGGMKYAFDLRSLGFPPKSVVPNAYGPQEVTWARQLARTLVVQTNHLGYASDSGGRNGYLTAIDVDTGKVRWRSPALVANAQNFVVARGLIVSGYGFTAEKDWLYLVDPATGRVRDRLALPSMAERISLRGDRIVVRCYDARVVARLVPA